MHVTERLITVLKKKLILFFLPVTLFCLSCITHAYAQIDLNQRLNFQVEGEQLQSVLLRLGKTSGIVIGFNAALFEKADQPIWYQAHDEKLSVILDRLLIHTDLTWYLDNGQIVISRKGIKPRAPARLLLFADGTE